MPPPAAAPRSRPRSLGPLARAVEAELQTRPHLSPRVAAWQILRRVAEAGDEPRLAELAADYPRLLALKVNPGPPPTLVPGSKARKKAGSVYTPDWLVEHLLEQTAQPLIDAAVDTGEPDQLLALRFCDPACGAGAFIVPLLDRLACALRALDPGAHPAGLLKCVCACDLDPLAARACRARLCARIGLPWRPGSLRDRIVVGESLTGVDWPERFPDAFARGGFDAVVGNPPFLGQLSVGTALPRDMAARLRERFGGAVKGYADTAAAFLLAAVEMTRDGGRVGMVLPLSVLASRDASGVRTRVLERGAIESAWIGEGGEFDAGVNACAVVVGVGGGGGQWAMGNGQWGEASVAVGRGLAQHRVTAEGLESSWASLAVPVWDLPACSFRASGVVGDRATATADFRDAYYGLQGRVEEEGEDRPGGGAARSGVAPLITSGMIGPLELRWGGGARIHKRAWSRPVADVGSFEGWLANWAKARLVPKVLVATQGRAMEAVADEGGAWLPVTPVISVMPTDPREVWKLLAAVASPVASVVAYRRWGGTGMSVQALKVSAKQVLELPVPGNLEAWIRGADLAREIQGGSSLARASGSSRREGEGRTLKAFGRAMLEAYEVEGDEADAVLNWWLGRLRVGNARG